MEIQRVTYLKTSTGLKYTKEFTPFQISIGKDKHPIIIKGHKKVCRESVNGYTSICKMADMYSNKNHSEYVLTCDGTIYHELIVEQNPKLSETIIYSTLD